jgi:2'-5' RNA ligase
METPSVTESQVKLMYAVCFDPQMNVFSQCSNIPSDPIEKAFEMARAAADADYLVTLGFLRDITEDHPEAIKKMNEESGRVWRAFEITATGRGMFGIETNKVPY